jgi:hypothetical protein
VFFATPFAFDSKAVLTQDLPGNHLEVAPALSVQASVEEVTEGDVFDRN